MNDINDINAPTIALIVVAFTIFGFIAGFDYGSPVSNITEIVWVETHNPVKLLDLECRMVRK